MTLKRHALTGASLAMLAILVMPAMPAGRAVVHADSSIPGPLESGANRGASIHQLDLERWNSERVGGWVPWRDPTALASPLRSRADAPTREVHGYHPYWMGGSYASYDWSLLTTVAFFSLELNGAGQITDDHGWPWAALVSAAHEHGVRVLVTATLFSSAEINALLSNPAARQNAIANLVDAVVASGIEGVNIDFEGVPGSRKQDLVTFLGELRDALDAAVEEPYLSIATPAVDWADAFDYDELAARSDHLMIMGYDYHWSGSDETGPVAPLAGWGTYNVSWTIADYQTWGAPPSKMLLGVPYYGYRWGAVSGEPAAVTTTQGVARTYAQAQGDAETYGPLWDPESSTPWYRYQSPTWYQGWYDDGPSLSYKYDLVVDESLAGVGIWALGYDGSRPELWAALADAFGGAVTSLDPWIPYSGPVPRGPRPSSPGIVEPTISLALVGANPFQGEAQFLLEPRAPISVSLAVHDVGGCMVRRLLRFGTTVRAPLEVRWDGLDETGRSVPPGVYMVRLGTPGSALALRVVRLK